MSEQSTLAALRSRRVSGEVKQATTSLNSWPFLEHHISAVQHPTQPLLPTVPVTGTLLYRGEPVVDGWVVFLDPLPDARSALVLMLCASAPLANPAQRTSTSEHPIARRCTRQLMIWLAIPTHRPAAMAVQDNVGRS